VADDLHNHARLTGDTADLDVEHSLDDRSEGVRPRTDVAKLSVAERFQRNMTVDCNDGKKHSFVVALTDYEVANPPKPRKRRKASAITVHLAPSHPARCDDMTITRPVRALPTCFDCLKRAKADGFPCVYCGIDPIRARGLCRWCVDVQEKTGSLPIPAQVENRRHKKAKPEKP
jgi:hypothetical protein